MKRSLLAIATILMLVSLASADEWLTDYAKALSQAKTQNKLLLIDFTGSDWCPWCMKLEKEVFSLPDFKNYAAKKFVLLKIDFPKHKTLPETEKAQNKKLAVEFDIHKYPSVILLNADGVRTSGRLGYKQGGPSVYIAALEKMATKP